MDSIDDLLRMGTLTSSMAMFLEACVKAKFNIIISGGTGTGKTTFLNILSGFIDDYERIITIEDAAEADRLITVLMGDEVGERKKYIFEHAQFNKEDNFAKIKR